ncbi:phage tail protein [Oceanobacillus timonensis]|uniref:phage tail protein n=1 Tax=Oceanobacillus timonensis TaxID=1926285 RepID=UPI0009BBE87C|nr:phage tail protein [Oceanobacillus timonensis]
MYVRDLNNKEYVVMATIEVDHDLNSDKILTADLEYNKPNSRFLMDLAELWTLVDDDETEWKIVAVQKQGEGQHIKAQIRAIPKFFDDFNISIVHDLHSGSMTATRALNIIFADSGYDYVLNGDYSASEWDNFGGGTKRLKMFQDWLNRYGGEFQPPVGNTVFIDEQVGEDKNIMYRHRLNASNIVYDVDASEMYTYIKGYADYEGDKQAGDWQDAKLTGDYTSPLANILGIRESEPVKDGRIRNESTLHEKMKKTVDESIKISVTADIHDLRKQGYPIGQTNVGDRVFLIDERIGFNEEVRIVNQKETKNWKGEIIALDITFGSQDIVKRHQSKMNNATNAINDVLEGKRKLPMNALNNEVAQVTNALLSAQTELEFENGIIARDPNNPNLVVVLNSAGLGISQDGGRTFRNAITGRGILAEHILAGTITAGGNRRIDISDGRVWSYVGDKLTMNFGRYGLDFYHYDQNTLFTAFTVGYIENTNIPILSMHMQREGALSLGVTTEGYGRSSLRIINETNNKETIVSGTYSSGQSSLGLFSSARLWEDLNETYRHNQASIRLQTSNHSNIQYYGRSGSNSTFEVLYNHREGATKRLVADSSSVWVNRLDVGSTSTVRDYGDAVFIGTDNNRNGIRIFTDGEVAMVADGVIRHSFYPNGKTGHRT